MFLTYSSMALFETRSANATILFTQIPGVSISPGETIPLLSMFDAPTTTSCCGFDFAVATLETIEKNGLKITGGKVYNDPFLCRERGLCDPLQIFNIDGRPDFPELSEANLVASNEFTGESSFIYYFNSSQTTLFVSKPPIDIPDADLEIDSPVYSNIIDVSVAIEATIVKDVSPLVVETGSSRPKLVSPPFIDGDSSKPLPFLFNPRLGDIVTKGLELEAFIEVEGKVIGPFPDPVLGQISKDKFDLSVKWGDLELRTSAILDSKCMTNPCLGDSEPYNYSGIMQNFGTANNEENFFVIRASSSDETVNGHFENTWTVNPTLTVTHVYFPKTQEEYIRDAIQLSQTEGGDVIDVVDRSWNDIKNLRETSDATSSQNTNLRDAEWQLRGYAGGQRRRTGQPGFTYDDIMNTLIPVSATVYESLKFLKSLIGQNISGDDNLKSSGLGGLFQAYSGWASGLLNRPVESLWEGYLDILDAPSTNPTEPEMPENTLSLNFGGDSVDVGFFETGLVESGETYFYDPAPRGNYVLFVEDNLFSSIILPSGQGFSTFDIRIGDQLISWMVDELLDITSYLPGGVDSLGISNFDSPITTDGLVYGLQYLHDGQATLRETSFDEIRDPRDSGAVPEPATLAIFGLGLAGLGVIRRRRRTG